jgi:hypothetical protein
MFQDHPVAHGANGFEVTGLAGVIAEFTSEGGDMDIDGAVEDFVIAFPDFAEQLFAGFHAAGVAGEAEEEIEFDGGEGERLSGERGGAGGGVEAEVAHHHLGFRGVVGGGGCRGGAVASGDGAQSGEQFAGRGGFGEVIVSPDFEADDAIGFIAAGGEHEDGDVGVPADLLERFEAVEAGEHDIEDHGVPGFAGGGGDAGGAVMDGFHLVAHGAEVIGEQAAEFTVVIDQEDAGQGVGGIRSPRGHGEVRMG